MVTLTVMVFTPGVMKTCQYCNTTCFRVFHYTKHKRSCCQLQLTVGEQESEANYIRGLHHVTYIRRLTISNTEFSGIGLENVLELVVNEVNPYPTAFPYGNGMVLHFYQQLESSTTKTVHKVINKGLKTYV